MDTQPHPAWLHPHPCVVRVDLSGVPRGRFQMDGAHRRSLGGWAPNFGFGSK